MVDIGNEDRALSATELLHIGHGEGGGSLYEDVVLRVVVTRTAIGGIPTTPRGIGRFETRKSTILSTFAAVPCGHEERIGVWNSGNGTK